MRQSTRTMSSSRHPVFAALSAMMQMTMLSTLIAGAEAQVGVTLCACQPSVWQIQLDFANSCASQTWVAGPGIQETFCNVASSEDPSVEVNDFEFVEVDQVQFIEADQNFDAVNTVRINGTFSSGDTLTLPSIINNATAMFDETTLPKLAQVDIFGVNAAGQSIVATWSLLFTNDCSSFPVVEAGEETILTIVTDVEAPPPDLCPIAAPSSSPSQEPSDGGPVIGVDLCACQPGSWEFTIDFSLSCDDTTFPEEITASRPGIVGSFCQAILLVPVGDPIYASIDSTTIVELDQDGAAISQQSIGALNDGDTFTYVSVLDAIPSFNSTTLPRSIVVSFTGMNAEGSPLNVLWLVEFNNDCQVFIDDENAFPVVVPGDQSASTLVSGATDPPASVCPVAGSESPSVSPSEVPSSSPVAEPSSGPSLEPSNSPSSSPSNEPSPLPSQSPSNSPSSLPSNAPSPLPSEIPSTVPSETVSGAPTTVTDAPSSEPTIIAPTCPPVATKQPKSSKSSKTSSPASQGGKGGMGKGKQMEDKPKMERMRMKSMSLMMDMSEVYYSRKSSSMSKGGSMSKIKSSSPPTGSPTTAAPSLSPTFSPSAAPTCEFEKSSKSPGKGGSMMGKGMGKSGSSMSPGKGGSMMGNSESSMSKSHGKGGNMMDSKKSPASSTKSSKGSSPSHRALRSTGLQM